MYEINLCNKVVKKSDNLVNYSSTTVPSGNACWPTIDLSHLSSEINSKNLERRCTDLAILNSSNLRNLDNLK
jgi:hypothetical protein